MTLSEIPIPFAAGKRVDDIATLARNPLLAHLGVQELGALLELLDQVAFPRGTVIERQGDSGDYLYFVLEGEARAKRGALELRTLRAGDHFGELALVGVRKRSLTVEATTHLRVARFSRDRYQRLALLHPMTALHFAQALATALGEQLEFMIDSVGVLMRERSLPRRAEIRVRVGDATVGVRSGTPVRALLPADAAGSPVVAAMLDRKPVALDTPITSDVTLDAVPLASWEGREVYRRSASLLLLEAAARAAPGVDVRLGGAVSGGRLVHVEGIADVGGFGQALEHALHRLVDEDAPFREELWMVAEARALFEERGWRDAAALLRTQREATVTLASCGDVLAIATGPMLASTGAIAKDVRVLAHPDGLLLHFGAAAASHAPITAVTDALEQERRRPRFGGAMANDHAAWLSGMSVTSVGAFDELCVSGRVAELVRVAEGFHEKRLGQLADTIAERRGTLRAIAIAGPSSSGKTTFIKRLTVQLQINGLHPHAISLDDYYVDRTATPRDPSGEYDFESLLAIDRGLLREHVAALLAGKTVKTARFDFLTGKSLAGGGHELHLGAGDVLLLEGIHGLNPDLLGPALPRELVFNVFLQPATTLAMDRLTKVDAADLRLLRRIVRDRHSRGYSAAENIVRWPSVRRGEALHIFPFQPQADAEFDSALAYEPAVLKVFAERYLLEVKDDHPAFTTAYRLRQLVDRFVAIHPDHVPPTSIAREFIGGSGFEY